MEEIHFLVFLILTSTIVGQPVYRYGRIHGDITLTPVFTGHFEEVLWKYNDNKAVEFESGKTSPYGQFKGRTHIDNVTAALTIRELRRTDGGLYKAEVQVLRRLQYTEFRMEIIDAVTQPMVQCERKGSVGILRCTAEAELGQYRWEGPDNRSSSWTDQPVEQEVRHEQVLGSAYTCVVRNPVSERSQTFLTEDCFTDRASPSLSSGAIAGIMAGLIAVCLVAAGLVCFMKWRKRPRGNDQQVINTNPEKDHLLPDTDHGRVRDAVRKIEEQNALNINNLNNTRRSIGGPAGDKTEGKSLVKITSAAEKDCVGKDGAQAVSSHRAATKAEDGQGGTTHDIKPNKLFTNSMVNAAKQRPDIQPPAVKQEEVRKQNESKEEVEREEWKSKEVEREERESKEEEEERESKEGREERESKEVEREERKSKEERESKEEEGREERESKEVEREGKEVEEREKRESKEVEREKRESKEVEREEREGKEEEEEREETKEEEEKEERESKEGEGREERENKEGEGREETESKEEEGREERENKEGEGREERENKEEEEREERESKEEEREERESKEEEEGERK